MMLYQIPAFHIWMEGWRLKWGSLGEEQLSQCRLEALLSGMCPLERRQKTWLSYVGRTQD